MICETFLKLFLIIPLLGLGQALIHERLARVFGSSVGTVTNVRTTQLLNQLCLESQAENTMERDACYGCFFRSSQQPSGYPMLLSMGECANKYLNDTDYGHCSSYLRNATTSVDTRVSPTTIYCTFLECIRQVNKDNLDALIAPSRGIEVDNLSDEAKFVKKKTSAAFALKRIIFVLRGICFVREIDGNSNTIRPGAEPIDPRRLNYIGMKNLMAKPENKMNEDQVRKNSEENLPGMRNPKVSYIRLCVSEAIRTFSNFTLTDVYLGQLFVNTTACILAKTRCSPTNPITGAYQQEDDITTKLRLTSINAILVNSDYDINIVQLPFGHGGVDECAKYRNIRQADWPTSRCIATSGFY